MHDDSNRESHVHLGFPASAALALQAALSLAAWELPASNLIAAEPATIVRAARVLDVRSGRYIEHAAILIDGQRIRAVGSDADVSKQAGASGRVIDLGDAVVLPGLIDCHTHLLARIPDGRYGYEINLLAKSQAYRALEGAANARVTLDAGFTSVRDVESEGSGYADVALRDAINEGLVEGPRMRAGPMAHASPCSSCSITRRAPRIACSMGILAPRRFSRRSSAPPPSRCAT